MLCFWVSAFSCVRADSSCTLALSSFSMATRSLDAALRTASAAERDLLSAAWASTLAWRRSDTPLPVSFRSAWSSVFAFAACTLPLLFACFFSSLRAASRAMSSATFWSSGFWGVVSCASTSAMKLAAASSSATDASSAAAPCVPASSPSVPFATLAFSASTLVCHLSFCACSDWRASSITALMAGALKLLFLRPAMISLYLGLSSLRVLRMCAHVFVE
mmetsp:Transcript_16437/g.38369  ORF Transcript_16437/g.38369 Transcript_16437/m.38369 type:complete len:219 (-) Transcript_16437:786-1442(-)